MPSWFIRRQGGGRVGLVSLVFSYAGPGDARNLLTVRTAEPLPLDIGTVRVAFVEKKVMSLFVLCVRFALAAGENLDELAYPEHLGISHVHGQKERRGEVGSQYTN